MNYLSDETWRFASFQAICLIRQDGFVLRGFDNCLRHQENNEMKSRHALHIQCYFFPISSIVAGIIYLLILRMEDNHTTLLNNSKMNMDMAAASSNSPAIRRTKSEFPIKLYAMLELSESVFEFAQAVAWLPHGRAFAILDKVKFMEDVVPLFFNQTKIRSFSRQLHLWGFRR